MEGKKQTNHSLLVRCPLISLEILSAPLNIPNCTPRPSMIVWQYTPGSLNWEVVLFLRDKIYRLWNIFKERKSNERTKKFEPGTEAGKLLSIQFAGGVEILAFYFYMFYDQASFKNYWTRGEIWNLFALKHCETCSVIDCMIIIIRNILNQFRS